MILITSRKGNTCVICFYSNGIESTLYAVSFLYYGTISMISTVVFGIIGSFLTGNNIL